MADSEIQRFEDTTSDGPAIRGYLHIPAGASGDGLVLTHGAGANCNSPLLVEVAAAFCDAGFAVLRCDLPFRQLKPKGPPFRGSAEKDQLGLHLAVEAMRRRNLRRVFLGGHSYGGRQSSIIAASGAASDAGLADGLLLLSYPLHPPKRPTELRTAHFSSLRTQALFVHGSRDAFGTIEEMTAALKLIPARTQLLVIENAGHELMSASNRKVLPGTIVGAFRENFE